MEFPKDLRYTSDHEWARLSGKKVTVGVTGFAVEQLGDITLVDLPDVGSTVSAKETFGTVESVKSVSDLFAPVSGTVTQINLDLEDSPELVNESPYEQGWLIEIELDDPAEFAALMDVKAYAKIVENAH